MTRPIQARTNEPHAAKWACDIGRLIQNFAAIELQTYWWLRTLGADEAATLKALEWPFKKRVDRVIELIGERVSDASLAEAFVSLWEEALQLAKLRNALAHNPLIFGWESPDETGPPDVIGIPDVAHLGSKPRVSQKITSASQLAKHINEAHRIASRLFEAIAELDSHLASGPHSESPRLL